MLLSSICCVFRPANGCSARPALVKIDFLKKTNFSVTNGKNKQKLKERRSKSCRTCRFGVKKLISTSERRAEHLFAGRNTKQAFYLKSRITVAKSSKGLIICAVTKTFTFLTPLPPLCHTPNIHRRFSRRLCLVYA